ncbi:alpha/beta fold hydrolase [Streptomyces sp. NBC_01497]|uniref:alpha/beta fold hydrolase n=1 Tax=Streptomyces sp. NBC_01497 TaxID=2903885 RepID=UPI002E339893|nr:alpha/beta hydrolase [Streptomyces sp. NBC_01497]
MSAPVPARSLQSTRTSDHTVASPAGPVGMTVQDRDRTRSFLLLHGGGGTPTMAGFADLLAEHAHARVLLPTHPGFGGTSKPDALTGVTALARAYVALLDEFDLTNVTVVGNSFGGWLAAEIALQESPRVSGAVIVDGVGIEVDGHPMTSLAGMTPQQISAYSFHDPRKAPVPPVGQTGPSPDFQALTGYTGPTMSDPTLTGRLAGLHLPVQVIWGESDGIVTPDYGRAYAAAIPGAAFTLLPRTGHLPQLETPEEVLGAILDLGV